MGRNERAERVTEDRELIELERFGEQIDVGCEGLERERLWIDTVGAALSTLVYIQHTEVLAEGIEVRPKHRVIHPTAVQHDQREPLADLLDADPVAVAERNEHCQTLGDQSTAPR